MHFGIYNNQAFGDKLIGTHLAGFLLKDYPFADISFIIPINSTLTTAENNKIDALKDMMYILSLQYGISNVYAANDQGGLFNKDGFPVYDFKPFNKVYHQTEWFSDLGIVKSALAPYAKERGWEGLHTDLAFFMEIPRNRIYPRKAKVATAGQLDWFRKWSNEGELQKLLDYLRKCDIIDLVELGVDTHTGKYSDALNILKDCDLFIGPMGSLTHAAVGFGLSTISLRSVFPTNYDCPEYYDDKKWHKSVGDDAKHHCKTYKCITPKLFTNSSGPGFGNPPVSHSFWSQTCPYTADGISCVKNTKANKLITYFEEWLERDKNSRV